MRKAFRVLNGMVNVFIFISLALCVVINRDNLSALLGWLSAMGWFLCTIFVDYSSTRILNSWKKLVDEYEFMLKDIFRLINIGALPHKEAKNTNRVEVIDEKGRSYVNWDDKNEVKLSFQDAGKTLKVFITKKD